MNSFAESSQKMGKVNLEGNYINIDGQRRHSLPCIIDDAEGDVMAQEIKISLTRDTAKSEGNLLVQHQDADTTECLSQISSSCSSQLSTTVASCTETISETSRSKVNESCTETCNKTCSVNLPDVKVSSSSDISDVTTVLQDLSVQYLPENNENKRQNDESGSNEHHFCESRCNTCQNYKKESEVFKTNSHNSGLSHFKAKYDSMLPELLDAVRIVGESKICKQVKYLMEEFQSFFGGTDSVKGQDNAFLFVHVIKNWSTKKSKNKEIFTAKNLIGINSFAVTSLKEAKYLKIQVNQLIQYFSELSPPFSTGITDARGLENITLLGNVNPSERVNDLGSVTWSLSDHLVVLKSEHTGSAKVSQNSCESTTCSDYESFRQLSEDTRRDKTRERIVIQLGGRNKTEERNICKRQRVSRSDNFSQIEDRNLCFFEDVHKAEWNNRRCPATVNQEQSTSKYSDASFSVENRPFRKTQVDPKMLREIWKPRSFPHSLEDAKKSAPVSNINSNFKHFHGHPASISPWPGKQKSETDDILQEMISYTHTLVEREFQTAAFKMNICVLTEQIEEAESTLDACNRFLEAGWVSNLPRDLSALRRELCIFQNDMIDRILYCLDKLYESLNPLSKAELEKSWKNTSILKNFEKLKKEKDEIKTKACSLVKDMDTADDLVADDSFDDDIYKVMTSVILGLDLFESTCVDLWDIALGHIFDILEHSLITRRAFLLSKSLSKSRNRPASEANENFLTIKLMEISKDTLDCFSRQLSWLMILVNIKTLQTVSLDHHLGMAFLYLKEKCSMPSVREDKGRNKSSNPVAEGKRKISISCLNESGYSNEKVPYPEEKQCDSFLETTWRKPLRKTTNGTSTSKPSLKSRTRQKRTNTTQYGRKLGRCDANNACNKVKQYPPCSSGTQNCLSFPPVKLKKVAGADMEVRSSQHMKAAADMPVPLLELSSSNKKPPTLNRNGNRLHAIGISPWVHRTRSKTDALRQVSKKPPHSIAGKFSGTSTKDSDSLSSAVTCSSLTRTTSLPKFRGKAAAPKKRVFPRIVFRKEVAEFRDHTGRVVDCMGNLVESPMKKAIYYSRLNATPIPPHSGPTRCLPKLDIKMDDETEHCTDSDSGVLPLTRKKTK